MQSLICLHYSVFQKSDKMMNSLEMCQKEGSDSMPTKRITKPCPILSLLTLKDTKIL